MPPYSNRPYYGEPQPLGSGDFEAVGSNAPQIPRAPRSPAFPEHSARGGHPWNPTGPFPQQGPSSNRIPPAPHSLSPVAMASARGAVGTGPQMAIHDQTQAARPSTRAGMSILFAGAIIGGLIGAVMHARQNAADAFAAQSEPTRELAPPPLFIPPIKDEKRIEEKKSDPKLDDKKIADDRMTDDRKDKKTTARKWQWAAPAKAKSADKGSVTDAVEKPSKKKGSKDDDGYTIAGVGSDEKTADSKPDKAEKPAKKSEAKAEKPEKKSVSSAGSKSDDAVNVLKAAMGATENTL